MSLVLCYYAYSIHEPPPPSFSAATYAAVDTSRYRPSCYHHLFFTHVPVIHTLSSQSYIIVRVMMYCAAVLYLFSTQ